MNTVSCAHFHVCGFPGKLAASSGGDEGCTNACRKLRQVQETKMHYLFIYHEHLSITTADLFVTRHKI